MSREWRVTDGAAPHSQPPRLLDQLRDRIRLKHYSIRTEQVYIDWVRRFILFHGKQHPRELGPAHVEAFLTHLAVERNVAASTQNQAKSAILFLYRAVLGVEMPWLDDVESAKRPQRLPVVLTRDEVQAIFLHLEGLPGLLVRILYGTGMRILELLRLRVKDVDFVRREILIRDGKGAKDRVTMLPDRVALPVREHLERVQAMHARDLKAGYGSVYLPFALALKYPNASREWAWQYVFPAIRASKDPRTGVVRRHHLDEAGVQKVVKAAQQFPAKFVAVGSLEVPTSLTGIKFGVNAVLG